MGYMSLQDRNEIIMCIIVNVIFFACLIAVSWGLKSYSATRLNINLPGAQQEILTVTNNK